MPANYKAELVGVFGYPVAENPNRFAYVILPGHNRLQDVDRAKSARSSDESRAKQSLRAVKDAVHSRFFRNSMMLTRMAAVSKRPLSERINCHAAAFPAFS